MQWPAGNLEESMARLGRVLSAAVIIERRGALLPVVRPRANPYRSRTTTQAVAIRRLTGHPGDHGSLAGSISGIVSDERGEARSAAPRVSAIGVTMALAATRRITAASSTDSLPAGEYVVSAHIAGFIASRRELVRVGEASTAVPQLQVRRLDSRGRGDRTVCSQPPDRARRGSTCPRPNRPATTPKMAPRDAHPHSEDGLASAPHQAQHPERPLQRHRRGRQRDAECRRPRCSAVRWAVPPTSPVTRLRSSQISRSQGK